MGDSLYRATGFPYISPISSGLRWRGERYIPKNVFFPREEVLIYDAPESATFPRMFSDSEIPNFEAGASCSLALWVASSECADRSTGLVE